MIEFFNAHSFVIAQIFGFCAMATAITMYQFKKHRTIMVLTALCSTLWCLHFASLGLVTPILMNFINILRGITYSNRSKPWGNKKFIPYIFAALSVILTVITWENAWSILPCIGSIFSSFANWQTNTKKLKLLTIPVCVVWFTYNTVNSSYAGMANETFTLISIIIALIRINREDKKEELKAENNI